MSINLRVETEEDLQNIKDYTLLPHHKNLIEYILSFPSIYFISHESKMENASNNIIERGE
jgi:hypothetical protein